MLRETIDLGITTPVQPAASGERKRKRELELSEEQLLGIADSHLLKAEKAVDKAVEQAEAMMRKAEEIEAQLEQADHTLKRSASMRTSPGSKKHSGGSIGASR